MPKVNFYLKDNHAKSPTLINLFFSYSGKRFKWFTGNSIHPKDWSFTRKRPKRLPELTRNLDNLAIKVKEIHAGFLADGINPRPDQIKAKLNEIYRKAEEEAITFFGLLTSFVNDNPKNLAPNTLKQYKTLLRHMREFVEATGYYLNFATITRHFDDAFYEYLTHKEKPLSPSSVNKVYGILKAFLTYATRKGYNENMVFQTFQHNRKKTLQIALTQQEVNALEGLDLSGKLALYRDAFLFSCETAMEFSALARLKPSDIKEKVFVGLNEGKPVKYAAYFRKKTGGQVTPPLNDKALSILEKYASDDRETCFPPLNNQVYNRSLKSLGELANIADPVEVASYRGTQKVTAVKSKFELITTHTGRRTFVTLFIEQGGTNEACRVYTGHATNKQLEEYRKDTLQHKMALAFQDRNLNRKMDKVG